MWTSSAISPIEEKDTPSKQRQKKFGVAGPL